MEVLHGNDDDRPDDPGGSHLQRAARPFALLLLFPSSANEATAGSDRAARHAR
jgi:hypothetical protein